MTRRKGFWNECCSPWKTPEAIMLGIGSSGSLCALTFRRRLFLEAHYFRVARQAQSPRCQDWPGLRFDDLVSRKAPLDPAALLGSSRYECNPESLHQDCIA